MQRTAAQGKAGQWQEGKAKQGMALHSSGRIGFS
jgi:hypothetical protein